MMKNIFLGLLIFFRLNLVFYGDEVNNTLVPFEKNGMWGYKNETETEVISPQFVEAKKFQNGYAVVKIFNREKLSFEYGIIKENGEFKVKPKYDFLSEIYNDRVIYTAEGKYGVMSEKGKIILEAQFDKISNFSEDTFVFNVKNKYGYMDKDGNTIVPPLFDEAYSFKNGYAKVKYNGKYKFVDKTGNVYDKNPLDLSKNQITDLTNLPQDANFFLNENKKSLNLLLENYSKLTNNNFDKMYFLPWHKNPTFSQKEFISLINAYKNNYGYGENKLPHNQSWIDAIIANADSDTFPSMNRKAITLRNSDIRLLPTKEPIYNNFDLPGQGYPFDMIQNSGIHVNTPILVTHRSKNGEWYFVETPFCEGWMHSDNIAFVDDSFVKNWETGNYKAIINDKVPFYDEFNNFKFSANIGAIFPSASDEEVYFATEGANKTAVIMKQKMLSTDVTQRPLKLTNENVALIINRLIGKPYGWGGFLENRDCSSTLKDLFAVFGIWLPRNSAEQAKNMIFISLKDLSPEEKEKMIVSNGVPFATLVWMNGHIMLYIGNVEGKPIIFHNMWGIRTKDEYGNEGRRIVGSSVITTLEPGKEFADTTSLLLDKIEGITILVPPIKLQNMISSY